VSEVEPQITQAGPARFLVTGPMTFQTARRLCEAGIWAFIRDASPMIVVDCAGVTHADSAGLAVLIEWRRWSHLQGRHLQFASLPTTINAIAQLSEVSELLADAVA
jgi:phospholipid transport system transporter-binding protein